MAPTPAMPTEALSGLALSQAISPFRSSAGRLFLPTINSGSLPIRMIGSRSFKQIELQGVEAAGQHMRGRGADAQRVAVGGRANRAADAEAAGGAADVLDDDGLAENGPQTLSARNRASVSVAPPAGNGTIMVIGRVG